MQEIYKWNTWCRSKTKRIDKSAIAGFISNADLDKKIAILASKAELKAEQGKVTKLQAFD